VRSLFSRGSRRNRGSRRGRGSSRRSGALGAGTGGGRYDALGLIIAVLVVLIVVVFLLQLLNTGQIDL
jgi:hypothetical protein